MQNRIIAVGPHRCRGSTALRDISISLGKHVCFSFFEMLCHGLKDGVSTSGRPSVPVHMGPFLTATEVHPNREHTSQEGSRSVNYLVDTLRDFPVRPPELIITREVILSHLYTNVNLLYYFVQYNTASSLSNQTCRSQPHSFPCITSRSKYTTQKKKL